jgi:hypothetical protein
VLLEDVLLIHAHCLRSKIDRRVHPCLGHHLVASAPGRSSTLARSETMSGCDSPHILWKHIVIYTMRYILYLLHIECMSGATTHSIYMYV